MLGWKYVAAEDESQRYKVGKFILETKKTCAASCWEHDGGDGGGVGMMPLPPTTTTAAQVGNNAAELEVEFDSQDEEECEDLFAGVWSAAGAARRRQGRRFARERGGR